MQKSTAERSYPTYQIFGVMMNSYKTSKFEFHLKDAKCDLGLKILHSKGTLQHVVTF